MIFTTLILVNQEQEIVVEFVDNIDFVIGDSDTKRKMKGIINMYAVYYKATRGYAEYNKIVYYSQR